MPRSRGADVDSYGNDWDEEEAFRANQRRYAAAKKAQQAADHDRLATGTNESDVEEARVGNRMSDIEIGSPKVVYYKGKAVGEVGLDHEASPGNGPFYMKHYLTGKDMVGYDTKKEALADLKHLVQQMDEGVAEGELTEASIKLVDGQYQVVHNGKVVGTYPGRYAAQDHAHRLNNKPTKTRGKLNANEGVAEGSEADIDKKIAFHQQGQAAAQYKGSMNKMHAKKIRDLEASKKSMGLHASLEQHADDKMKELGHKFRPVGESKKTVSEMTAGGTGAGGFATGPTAGGGKPGTGKPKKIGNMLKRTTPKIGTGIYK
jgi:hypothetical protein